MLTANVYLNCFKQRSIMKNINEKFESAEYITAGKKRNIHAPIITKDSIAKNLEIIIISIMAFIVGLAVHSLLG